jgi:hypothetical protein
MILQTETSKGSFYIISGIRFPNGDMLKLPANTACSGLGGGPRFLNWL